MNRDWTLDALCAETDPEAFFPEKGGSTREAKAICASCDVTELCLTWAMEHGERFGIWGGKSERERRKIARERGIEVSSIYGLHIAETRSEAIALVRSGIEVKEVAAQLGVTDTGVYRWLKAAEVAA